MAETSAPDDEAASLPASPKPTPRLRLLLGLVVVATLAIAGFSLWVHWSWLRTENDRLEPVYKVLIWTGDVTTLFWVAWFGVWYALLGRPLPAAGARDPQTRFLIISLVAAFAVDVLVTAVTTYDENAAESRAINVPGQIVDGRPSVNGKKGYLTCRFQDRGGAWHEAHLHVGLTDQPAAMRGGIEAGRFPMPVVVSYDTEWPPRCRLVGFDNDENNRLYWASFSFLLFQGLCIPFAVKYAAVTTAAGVIRLYNVVPLWAELLPLLMAAIGKFFQGEY